MNPAGKLLRLREALSNCLELVAPLILTAQPRTRRKPKRRMPWSAICKFNCFSFLQGQVYLAILYTQPIISSERSQCYIWYICNYWEEHPVISLLAKRSMKPTRPLLVHSTPFPEDFNLFEARIYSDVFSCSFGVTFILKNKNT